MLEGERTILTRVLAKAAIPKQCVRAVKRKESCALSVLLNTASIAATACVINKPISETSGLLLQACALTAGHSLCGVVALPWSEHKHRRPVLESKQVTSA